MNNVKYKKISFEIIKKKLNNTQYRDFITYYIEHYLKKINPKIYDVDQFIKKNQSDIDFYNKYNTNIKLYFHMLYDKLNKRFFAIERTAYMNNNFFDISFFKNIPVNKNHNVMYATNLFIDDKYRGQGMCKYLLERIGKNCNKNNVKLILSEIDDTNTPSIKCHVSNGFIKTNIVSYKNAYFYYKQIQ